KRKAAGPRQAQSRYEQLGRDLITAEEAYAAADAELEAAQSELEELERERTRLEARREALRQDPAMRDAGGRGRRRGDAREREERAGRDGWGMGAEQGAADRRTDPSLGEGQRGRTARVGGGERTARRTRHRGHRGRSGAVHARAS